MPGENLKEKMANLRAAYGYFMSHPGKKHLFMGQEFGETAEWSEAESLHWELLDKEEHSQMRVYVKALNRLYLTQPALYEQDFVPEGFQWVNCIRAQENIVAYVRRSRETEETVLVVCNFGQNAHEEFRIGVPFAGVYREILNSDALQFGGDGRTNSDEKRALQKESDGREYSIMIRIAPTSICVFQCTPESYGTRTSGGMYEEREGGMQNTLQKDGIQKGAAQLLSEKLESSIQTAKNVKPAKAAKAAKDVITKKGSDTLDKLSGQVGKLIKKK